MSSRETFARLCERVCGEQDWSLGPTGVELGLPGGRHQVVAMEFFEFQDQNLVRFYTTIGGADVLGPQRLALALQVNARLAYGALAVRDEQLIMTETLLLEDADSAEIRESLRYLAETADYYEKIFFGTDDH
jgi:hypothetical protein